MSIVNVKEIVEKKRVALKREILDLRDKGIIPKVQENIFRYLRCSSLSKSHFY